MCRETIKHLQEAPSKRAIQKKKRFAEKLYERQNRLAEHTAKEIRFKENQAVKEGKHRAE